MSFHWIPAAMVLTMLTLFNIFLKRNDSSASYIFDKVKVSAIVTQQSSSVSILIYFRVLPPRISRIPTHCTSSYEFLMK